jgi:hypothetical protein
MASKGKNPLKKADEALEKALEGKNTLSESDEREKRLTLYREVEKQYSICDIELGVLGHPCDRLSYDSTPNYEKLVGTILLWVVIILDTLVEIAFVAFHVGAGFAEAIPVVGPLLGAIEGLEIDDILDFFSLAIVFVYCGPVVAVIPAIPEAVEGVLEIVPFWVLAIAFWHFVVKPARKKGSKLKGTGLLDGEITEEDLDEFEKLESEGKI